MADNKQSQSDKQDKVTFELFTERYRYDPIDGHFYDKRPVDRPDCSQGYRKISVVIDGERIFVKAHRAAFLSMTGKWPENTVDHIDRDKGNNKWENLRDVSHSRNLHNVPLRPDNKSGYHGVSWRADIGKWQVGIDINGKRKHLGLFEKEKLEEAISVRKEAEGKKFGGDIDF